MTGRISFYDNWVVARNTSVKESDLTRDHNTINHHTVHKAVATGILRVGK